MSILKRDCLVLLENIFAIRFTAIPNPHTHARTHTLTLAGKLRIPNRKILFQLGTTDQRHTLPKTNENEKKRKAPKRLFCQYVQRMNHLCQAISESLQRCFEDDHQEIIRKQTATQTSMQTHI